MANGASSQKAQALARAAAAAEQVIEVDPAAIPPISTETFRTSYVKTESVDEERDEHDKIVQSARVELTFREPTLIQQPGGGVMLYGGTARETSFTPEFAISVGEELAQLGREALETMKEQPLKPVGLEIAAGPEDVARVAAAAEAAKDLTSP